MRTTGEKGERGGEGGEGSGGGSEIYRNKRKSYRFHRNKTCNQKSIGMVV